MAVAQNTDKLQISLLAGYGQRLGGIPDASPEFQEYAKSLRGGFSLAVDIAHYFNPKWGVGLKASRFGLDNTFVFDSQDPILNDQRFDDTCSPPIINFC